MFKTATLLLAVGMLLLPPKWCCAIPGIQAECCEACKAKADAGNSCCACAEPENEAPAKRQPCKCLCHDQVAQLDKGPDHYAAPAVLTHVLPLTLPAAVSAPCFVAARIPPPHDFQSRLCRWSI